MTFPDPLPESVLRELRLLVGPAAVLSDPARLLVYEADGLASIRGLPSAVILPDSTESLAGVLRVLAEAGVPFVPRGAGTGLSGGAVAVTGAAVVGTSRMNRILSLDPERRRAVVQPGVLNLDLSAAALPFGLAYAPDPSSQSACTLGGNVAENSGGPHCLKYGVTSRWVESLRVVLPEGDIVSIDRGDLEGGLDLAGLFIGSEGCFGVAAEIELALHPLPEATHTLLAIFDEIEAAAFAVTAIIARGMLPAALEIMDGATIRAVESSIFRAGLPTDAGAALVVEFDGMARGLEQEGAEAEACCREWGAREVRRAETEEGRAALWRGRKKAFGAMGRIAPDLLVQDATVPRSRLPEVLRTIGEVAARHRVTVANVFHAGDGNLHPNLLHDRRNGDEAARVARASSEIMRACVDAGGTITGEHGVGSDKREYMSWIHERESLLLQGRVRRCFDPRLRSNPAKVLPDEIWEEVRREVPDSGRNERENGAGGRPGGAGRAWPPVPLRHEPADLTVRVDGRMPLGDLAPILAAEGQWLPLDPPGWQHRSIGEILLRGEGGSLQRAFGRPRDLLLGATFETGDGRLLELGGRVVKNVAGFDLLSLVTGSRGRLGRIRAATLRLHPLPAMDRTLLLRTATAGEGSALLGLLRSAPEPLASFDLLGPGHPDPSEGRWTVAVRFLGSSASVEEMAERVRIRIGRDAAGEGAVEWLDGEASAAFHGRIAEREGGMALTIEWDPPRGAGAPPQLAEADVQGVLAALGPQEDLVETGDPPDGDGRPGVRDVAVAVRGGSGVVRILAPWRFAALPASSRSRLRAFVDQGRRAGGRVGMRDPEGPCHPAPRAPDLLALEARLISLFEGGPAAGTSGEGPGAFR